MRIGEISRRLGVCPDTIRRLERQGIIRPPRDWNEQRRFTEEDLAFLKKVLFSSRGRPLRPLCS